MSILDAAEEEAVERGANSVAAIYVKIGLLSGVVAEALSAAYDLARENTRLSGTRLVIEEVSGAELLVSALEFAE